MLTSPTPRFEKIIINNLMFTKPVERLVDNIAGIGDCNRKRILKMMLAGFSDEDRAVRGPLRG